MFWGVIFFCTKHFCALQVVQDPSCGKGIIPRIQGIRDTQQAHRRPHRKNPRRGNQASLIGWPRRVRIWDKVDTCTESTTPTKLSVSMRRTQVVVGVFQDPYPRRVYPCTMTMRYHLPLRLRRIRCTSRMDTDHPRVLVPRGVHPYLCTRNTHHHNPRAKFTLCRLRRTGTMLTLATRWFQRSLNSTTCPRRPLLLLPTGTTAVWCDVRGCGTQWQAH